MVLPELTPKQKKLMIEMASSPQVKVSFSIYEEGMMVFNKGKKSFSAHWFEYLLLQIAEDIANSKTCHLSFYECSHEIFKASLSSAIHPVEKAYELYTNAK